MAKQVDLSLSEKVKLVPELELPSVTQESVAKKYVFLHRRCHVRLSKKDDFIRNFKSGGNRSRKRKREGNEDDVGNVLFLWFEQKLGQGARLSGLLLKQKACELARTQGTDCTRSDGWLRPGTMGTAG